MAYFEYTENQIASDKLDRIHLDFLENVCYNIRVTIIWRLFSRNYSRTLGGNKMFCNPKKKEMLLRLYAKSRTIGYVPSFEEMNEMADMPPANRYALSCGSYAKAARTVQVWLDAKPKEPHEVAKNHLPKEVREEMKRQDKAIANGWVPIHQRIHKKTFQQLLDEMMKQADQNGLLPEKFSIGYDLSDSLNLHI